MSEEPLVDPVEKEKRRSRLRTYRLVAALLAAGGVYWGFSAIRESREWRARLTAPASRITLEQDGGASLSTVERAASPDVWFRVILHDPPIGKDVPLACRWTDPVGTIAHANSWKTKPITHDDWETHCRYRLGPTAQTGLWKVEMSFEGRTLSSASFEVR